MENLKLLMVALIFSINACSRVGYVVHEPAQSHLDLNQFVSGILVGSDDKKIDLGKTDGLPLVLIFSNDSCSTCAAEAEDIKKALYPATQPTKIHLYTELNGAIKDDAVYWKKIHNIPWDVGYDENSNLFMKYCTDHTLIPCTVIQMPSQGIVLVHQGQMDTGAIQKITGAWL